MRLTREWIERHIPHQGRMCLLDEIVTWDPTRITCRSGTHRAPDHPLRAHARLGAACGIEYAAQAMALHGALLAGAASASAAGATSASAAGVTSASPAGAARQGYLASVRNVLLTIERLDDLEDDLIATAERVTGDDRTVLYEFEVVAGTRVLLSGRAGIVFWNPT
jgi:predicted hotdog family 3-hydroxylacyl-ACP dehydratase